MSITEQAILMYIKYHDYVTIDDLSEDLQAKKVDIYPFLKRLCSSGKVRKHNQYYQMGDFA